MRIFSHTFRRQLLAFLVNVWLLLAHKSLTVLASDYQQNSTTTNNNNHNEQPTEQIKPNSNINNNNNPPTTSLPFCTLGDDTFQIGERWNPNLPPFGVQVCVQCECTIRQRKLCYETKVICRRITNECPIIDSCPDGNKPITVAGQCCKSCQSITNATTVAMQSQQSKDGQLQSNSPESSSADHHVNARSLTITTNTPPPPTTTTNAPLPQPPTMAPTEIANITHLTPAPPPDITTTTDSTPTTTIPPTTTIKPLKSSTNHPSILAISMAFKMVYMNERTKDYLSMVKNLPACPSRDGNNGSNNQQATVASQSLGNAAMSIKTNKQNNRKDLNGIDSRLAFKSLHDVAPNQDQQQAPSSKTNRMNSASRIDSFSMHPSGNTDDSLHQHPNDVQSITLNLNNQQRPQQQQINGLTKELRPTQQVQQNNQSPNACLLGNETFQIGDIWNPILPPFGVQVCVQCSCIFRVRRACYEPRVVCRRVNKDCPILDTCPDGKQPITVAGQCCKSCQSTPAPPTSADQTQVAATDVITGSGVGINRLHAINNESVSLFYGLQRNEKVLREFQTISRALPTCSRRENVDIYNSNRYLASKQRAKRSQ